MGVRVLKRVDKILVKIADWSVYISVLCLMVATVLSFVNILTTKLFHYAIQNTTELVQYLLVPIVYCSVAKIQLSDGLMHVDLISRKFPKWLQSLIDSVSAILGTFLYSFAGWAACDLFWKCYTQHKTAANSLSSFVIWPFVLVYIVFSFLLAVSLLWSLIRKSFIMKAEPAEDADIAEGGETI